MLVSQQQLWEDAQHSQNSARCPQAPAAALPARGFAWPRSRGAPGDRDLRNRDHEHRTSHRNTAETCRRELRAEPWLGHSKVGLVPTQRSGYKTGRVSRARGLFQRSEKQSGLSPVRAGLKSPAVFTKGSVWCEGCQLSARCAAAGSRDPFLFMGVKQRACILSLQQSSALSTLPVFAAVPHRKHAQHHPATPAALWNRNAQVKWHGAVPPPTLSHQVATLLTVAKSHLSLPKISQTERRGEAAGGGTVQQAGEKGGKELIAALGYPRVRCSSLLCDAATERTRGNRHKVQQWKNYSS